jgi:NADH dehydrogenase FAD-containing subunit
LKARTTMAEAIQEPRADGAIRTTAGQQLPQVVIVGGGFGGVAAAKALRNAPVSVLLIDRSNHHLFQPLLYQVATASQAGAWLGAETGRVGRVRVDPLLRLPGRPEVFVVGDTASLDQDGHPLPGVAQVAMQQGRYVGRSIRRLLMDKPKRSLFVTSIRAAWRWLERASPC